MPNAKQLCLHDCPREEQQGRRKLMQLCLPDYLPVLKLMVEIRSLDAPYFCATGRHNWSTTELSVSLSLSEPEYSIVLLITELQASWNN